MRNVPELDVEALGRAVERGDPGAMYTLGRHLYQYGEEPEARRRGVELLLQADRAGWNDATFLVGQLCRRGWVNVRDKEGKLLPRDEAALLKFRAAANRGHMPARNQLSLLFGQRYRAASRQNAAQAAVSGPLVDFNGRPFHIRRTGRFCPVDAVLSCENGVNLLTLSLRIKLVETFAEGADLEQLRRTVEQGMQDWAGNYTVFGGQKLRVQVEFIPTPSRYDVVTVVPFSEQSLKEVSPIFARIPLSSASALFRQRRSFEQSGLRWSVTSRKRIVLFLDRPQEELRQIVRHEFGHVLGLGDLYADPSCHLPGVPNDQYWELDAYSVAPGSYYQVMCDHRAPVSNNDIEMVVLAFARNRMQHFQKKRFFHRVSEALGRGN